MCSSEKYITSSLSIHIQGFIRNLQRQVWHTNLKNKGDTHLKQKGSLFWRYKKRIWSQWNINEAYITISRDNNFWFSCVRKRKRRRYEFEFMFCNGYVLAQGFYVFMLSLLFILFFLAFLTNPHKDLCEYKTHSRPTNVI